MNRAERRNQKSPKSQARKAGLTYLTLFGVIGGSVGIMSPAHAAVYSPTTCNELASDLTLLSANGGTLTADFTGNCDFAEGYIFQSASTIIGPMDGTLNLRFLDTARQGFAAQADMTISNLNFTRESDQTYFDYFIYGYNPASSPYPSLTVSNTTFSNASVSAAIYAEGQLTVSDSAFTNLTATLNAIYAGSTTNVSGSTFDSNTSAASGGAINSGGSLNVSGSSFNSNQALSGNGGAIAGGEVTINSSTFFNNHADLGLAGAIFANSVNVNNSTFVNNRASDIGAMFSQGGIVSNSTFWNNPGFPSRDTASSMMVINGDFFGNILANSDTSPVISNAVDRGANLFTDTSFVSTTTGVGASRLVTLDDLKLSALALNQTSPTNSGNTKTVAIGKGSIAEDYYTSDPLLDHRVCLSSCHLAATDQRGVPRPFGAGYDVGAFEISESIDPSPSETPEVTYKETLADTGSPSAAGYFGLVGLGIAAILGGSVGLLRRRKKA
jgi:LPXTG-motif cell wall-anchored protein